VHAFEETKRDKRPEAKRLAETSSTRCPRASPTNQCMASRAYRAVASLQQEFFGFLPGSISGFSLGAAEANTMRRTYVHGPFSRPNPASFDAVLSRASRLRRSITCEVIALITAI